MPTSVTLLLVEDEPFVMLSTQEALEAGGYTVLTAADGDEAATILRSRIDELTGLITDVLLPSGPNGWELARQARQLKPNISVVYATSDIDQEWPAQGVPKSVLVHKPYAPAQVVTTVSALLTDVDSSTPTAL